MVLVIVLSILAQSLPEPVCKSLTEDRKKYPSSLTSLCNRAGQPECPLGIMLNNAALKGGLGLAGKETGYWVISPAGKVASDILMRPDKVGWDVFTDAENKARVNCGNSIGTITNRPFVAPVDTNPPPNTCEEKLKELQYQIDNARCEIVWP